LVYGCELQAGRRWASASFALFLAPKRVVVKYIVLPLYLSKTNSCLKKNYHCPVYMQDAARCLPLYNAGGFSRHVICSARNADGTIAVSTTLNVLQPVATKTLLPMLNTGITTHETTMIRYLWHACEHRWSASTMRQAELLPYHQCFAESV
jgi:hypothetical protein